MNNCHVASCKLEKSSTLDYYDVVPKLFQKDFSVLAIQNKNALIEEGKPMDFAVTNPDEDSSRMVAFKADFKSSDASSKTVYHYSLKIDLDPHHTALSFVSIRPADQVILLRAHGVERPVLGIRIGKNYFFNIYDSSDPDKVSAMVNRVYEYMNNKKSENWILMGYFNCLPSDLKSTTKVKTIYSKPGDKDFGIVINEDINKNCRSWHEYLDADKYYYVGFSVPASDELLLNTSQFISWKLGGEKEFTLDKVQSFVNDGYKMIALQNVGLQNYIGKPISLTVINPDSVFTTLLGFQLDISSKTIFHYFLKDKDSNNVSFLSTFPANEVILLGGVKDIPILGLRFRSSYFFNTYIPSRRSIDPSFSVNRVYEYMKERKSEYWILTGNYGHCPADLMKSIKKYKQAFQNVQTINGESMGDNNVDNDYYGIVIKNEMNKNCLVERLSSTNYKSTVGSNPLKFTIPFFPTNNNN